MTRYSLSLGKPTLADRLLGRGLGIDAVLILAGVALTAIAAQVTVPIWPIPVTAQTVAVLLVGMATGALRGAISMTLYAFLGGVGLPIFSNSSSGIDWLSGSTGGYILGFIAAAGFAGWMAQLGVDRSLMRSLVVATVATGIIYLFGLPALAITQSLSLEETLAIGFYPLLLGAVIKVAVVAVINTAAWAAIRRMEVRDERRSAGELQ